MIGWQGPAAAMVFAIVSGAALLKGWPAVAIAAVIYLLLAFLDLYWLTVRCRGPRQYAAMRLYTPWTTLGRALALELSTILSKLSALEWSVNQLHSPIELPSANCRQASEFERAEIDPLQLFFEELIDGLRGRFRAKTAAVIFKTAAAANLSAAPVVIARNLGDDALPRGRLAPFLKSFADSYYFAESLNGIRELDLLQSDGTLCDLSLLGFGRVLSGEFRLPEGRGRGLLCILYEGDDAPYPIERERMNELCLDIEARLRARLDFVELRANVAAAQAKERRRREFLSHISHDIRSPLNNVRGILNLFREEHLSSDGKDLVETALANCSQVAERVEDVIDYSKHQAGKLEPRREPVKLSMVVEETLKLFAISAKIKGIDLLWDRPDFEVEIIADRRHVKRVLSNLLSNAIKYTRHGWVKTCIVVNDGIRSAIIIEDSGIGMSKEQLDLLFTPFTRFHSDNTVGLDTDGVGLGLSLSRILTELNGGTIRVDSRVGRGSRFIVDFPVRSVRHIAPNVRQPIAVSQKSGKKCVLILDDDSESVESLARNIERAGHWVVRSFCVSAAIEALQSNQIDCVISDYCMPEGGARRLVAFFEREQLDIPLLILSGRGSDVVCEFSGTSIAVTVLNKPCDTSIVLEWIAGQAEMALDSAMVA